MVTSRLDIGGTEGHLVRVLPALKRRGMDVTLYAMQRGGPLEAELLAHGVRVDGPKPARFLRWPRATLALARWLRRERPTVVHFFLPRPYVYGSMAAELAGHRRRIMSRRSLTDYRPNIRLLGGLERMLHRRTLGVIGNSRAVIEQLVTEVDDRSKVALIHNGIDLPPAATATDRRRMRQSLQIADETLVIAVVANLVAYKGHRDLIEALASIKDQLPAPWRLLAIGRDDGVGAELKRQAEAAHLSGNVLWLGQRPDVEALLAASDIFVLPSHQEGFSNALLEAMAAQVAPIATAVGGNLDAVVHNETGLLVPPGDPSALAAAILRLAKDATLRRRFGAAARARIEQYFTLEACVSRYEKLYRAMSENTPRPIAEILADRRSESPRDETAPKLERAN